MSQSEDAVRAGSGGGTGPASVERCYAAGLAALDRGEIEEARDWARRCEAAPGGADDARSAALQGAVAAETGDMERASEMVRRARRLAPADGAVARQLAETLAVIGAMGDAVGLLDEAARREPEDAALQVDLGYLRMLSGDARGARQALERAAALRPEDAAVARQLAQIYEAVGEPALATEALSRAARQSPSPRVLSDLARLFLQTERYAEADAAFRRLGVADPEHELFAQHGQTWCRIKRGDWRGALDVALSATRLDRFDLTTAFLAYAKDRLFSQVPDAAQREAELGERFWAELHEHAALHGDAADQAEMMEEAGA
jgi:tetratricopeptide (TPR) repeat protein